MLLMCDTIMPGLGLLQGKLEQAAGVFPCKALSKANLLSRTLTQPRLTANGAQQPKSRD